MSFSCGQKYTKDVQICCPENSYTSPKNLNVDPKKWVGKMMFSVELPHVNFCFANALIQGPSFKKPKRDSLSYWVFLQMLPSTTFSDSSETYAVFFNHVFFFLWYPPFSYAEARWGHPIATFWGTWTTPTTPRSSTMRVMQQAMAWMWSWHTLMLGWTQSR